MLARAGGHAGRVKLRHALDTFKPELAVIRSGVERRFRDLVLAAGLPRPQTNVFVAGCELDAYWEAADDLLLAGIELIRITDVRLDREPRETIARVAAHLERRRGAGGPRRSVA